jgi:hypothetical protein
MATAQAPNLAELYEQDETAWLEIMSELASCGRYDEMDFRHLSEYLSDMAKRDRREMKSRLLVRLKHLLKWEHQLEKRSGSWSVSIREQRSELADIVESRVLRNHAEAILADVYAKARRYAAEETGFDLNVFPATDSRTLDDWLADPDEDN